MREPAGIEVFDCVTKQQTDRKNKMENATLSPLTRGNAVITSANRGEVKKWLTQNGIPFAVSGKMTVGELSNVFNDTTDALLSSLKGEAAAVTEKAITDRRQTALSGANDLIDALAKITQGFTPQSAPIDETRIIELIQIHAPISALQTITIKTDGEARELPAGLYHNKFKQILMHLKCGNVAIVGPAGSGKTTLGAQLAQALGVKFYFTGAIASEYKLTGFIDAQGRIVSTAFRQAYESGGLFLFDEIDASFPQAVLAFNAALSNGHMDFPDGSVTKHKDFYCVAAANTYGTGADRVYVGRNQLDGATLDRFQFVELPYDEQLETALAESTGEHGLKCALAVQAIRRSISDLKIRHIVSPRATVSMQKCLSLGMDLNDAMSACVWKGLDADTVNKIKSHVVM